MLAVDPLLMERALRLAERGWGHVQPNPLVGAIVLRDGEVIAEGWHAACGGPHAEAVALQSAGKSARGATLYVTLEPCTHTGRTPPCTDAIIGAGVSRVVIGAADPNPEAGGGAARLREAGIEVVEDVARAEVRRQNAPFFHWHEHGTPWLALKLALAVDGAIGTVSGPRVLITGEAARNEANRLRAGFDAVLVGANTAVRDDPLLTVRVQTVRVPPVRVVLDSRGRLSPDSQLMQSLEQAPVLVFTSAHAPAVWRGALERAGAEVQMVAPGAGGLDLGEVRSALGRRGIHSVLCEGGARVAQALLAADRVERWYLFLAPRLLGPGSLKAFEPWPDAVASRWRLADHVTRGDDLELELERDRSVE